MEEPVLVSVVTPCLNPGPRLERCLESVATQTYPNVEHIVVDGGSSDGTVGLLKRHGVTWVSERDEGQSEALNKGFRMASGSILTWLNADDRLFPRAVTLAIREFKRAEDIGWVYGMCQIDTETGSKLWAPPRTLNSESFNWTCPIPQQGCFFTTRALEAVGGIDESLHLAMDFDLWIRFFDHGVVWSHVRRRLGSYEIHAESKTGSVPYADFLIEGARSLSRSGRKRAAAFFLGRAAAQRAFDAGRSDLEGIRVQMTSILARAKELDIDPSGRALKAAALAEAMVLDAGLARRTQWAMRVDPWRYRECRRAIWRGFSESLKSRITGRSKLSQEENLTAYESEESKR